MTAVKVRILGIGMGPQHLTPEVAEALRTADYVVAAAKGEADPLLAVRSEIASAYGLEVLAVPDPERDRAHHATPAEYRTAVRDWHDARVAAYEEVLRERGGTAAFLVWGDPSLYDSTIRIVASLAARLELEYDVLPGISATQLLAARHRLVLHRVGEPVLVTTGRRLREAVDAGHQNVIVLLNATFDLSGLEEWAIWWGANLGTASEELVAGRVGDVLPGLLEARARAKAAVGWVMDLYLLRAPESS